MSREILESSEWMEQKAKIVSIEEKIRKVDAMVRSGSLDYKEKIHYSNVKNGLYLALNNAYEKLHRIEDSLDYNLEAFGHYSLGCANDNYYKKTIEKYGCLTGFKF